MYLIRKGGIIMKQSIAKALRKVADKVAQRCFEITDNRALSSEKLHFEIKVGPLTDEQEFEIEDYLAELDEALDDSTFQVSDLYGLYTDDGITYKAHYSEVVLSSKLVDSFSYEQGFIRFKIDFEIVPVEYTGWDTIALTPDVFQEKLSHFTELDPADYDAYDE